MEDPVAQNDLAIVVVTSSQPVAVIHPLDRDELDAQNTQHEEAANAEKLSTIPEVSSSKEASSSSANHRSQTDSGGANRSLMPSSSTPSSSATSSTAASVTLGSTSSTSSLVNSVRHKGKSKEVTGSIVPLQSG
ncbi:suppressor protein SRP40-like [Zingiber officinale]|uniref:suppressor protein SRP40-like n=1 Tax=Zingiber officinale TaxID=94328 RepID=UPI001C4CEE36|nr:suppressor protein SRP40-like [Zingiber officinale]